MPVSMCLATLCVRFSVLLFVHLVLLITVLAMMTMVPAWLVRFLGSPMVWGTDTVWRLLAILMPTQGDANEVS